MKKIQSQQELQLMRIELKTVLRSSHVAYQMRIAKLREKTQTTSAEIEAATDGQTRKVSMVELSWLP